MSDFSPYDFMELEEKEDSCMRGVGNTHAQITYSLKNGKNDSETNELLNFNYDKNMRGLIDWLDVTFNINFYNLDFVYTLLFKFFDLPFASSINQNVDTNIKQVWEFDVKQSRGYSHSVSFGNIAIFYNESDESERGIKLSISGTGCRECELLFRSPFKWYDFFEELLKHNVNFTRIDLAIDDFNPYFDVGNLIWICDNGGLVSRFKTYDVRYRGLTSTGKNLGYTLYIGSMSSRLFVRIYEKNKESNVSYPWNRVEIQFSNERAKSVIEEIVKRNEHFGMIALKILRNYIKFCDPEQKKFDSNRSRWKSFSWWEKFLHDVEKLKLAEALPESTIETKTKYLLDKISKTFSMVMVANAQIDYHEFVYNMYVKGISKFNEKDINLINKYVEDKKRARNSRQKDDDIIDIQI